MISALLRFRAREIDLIGGMTMALMLGMGYFLVVAPTLENIAAHERARSDVRQEKERARQAAQQVALMERQIEDLREALRERWSAVPAADNYSAFLAELTTLAEGAGLAVDQVIPGKATAENHWSVTPISVQARGTFHAWIAFLRAVEDRRCGAQIHDFEVRADVHGALEIRVSFNLSMPSAEARALVEAMP